MSAHVFHAFARAAATTALALSFNVFAADPTPDPAEPYATSSPRGVVIEPSIALDGLRSH